MICDMHTHSEHSHDSTCPIADMARAAIEKGVSVFAVTDHCDVEYFLERDIPGRIARSVQGAKEAAKAFAGRVTILHGVEIGEGIWNTDYTNQILNAHEFDAVIGSVHAVLHDLREPYSVIDFTDISDAVIHEYMQQYFTDVLTMLHTIPCDILAHLTCPLRYIVGKYGKSLHTQDFRPIITDILSYIIEHHIALEVNTSGDDPMPDWWIIELYHQMGGRLITLGSDAHIRANLAKNFEKTSQKLRKIGFKTAYFYQNRKEIAYKL